MGIYDRYARIYDESGQIAFSIRMIPYLDELLQAHPPPARSLLDLACGTGTVALSFAHLGWDVYALDASPAMLERCREKETQAGQQVAWSQQDMREFILPSPVGLITCLYDSLNYMLTLGDLQRVMRRVAAALLPGGLFLADMNTRLTLEQVWGNNTFFAENSDLAVIMKSSFEPQSGISGVDLVGFIRQDGGLYERFDEHHAEVAYEQAEVEAAFADAGLTYEAAYSCFQLQAVTPETRRIMWVARKPDESPCHAAN